jgi:segregation and condensation protein A
MYELKLDKFSGPLEKLLEFIEEKKLKITEFSLAAITSDFLDYLKTIAEVEPRILADFVAVAAKLILIKSKSLLPEFKLTEEEEAGIKDLEERLKIYREFKLAENQLKNLWLKGHFSFSREFLSSLGSRRFFYPSPDLSMELLRERMEEFHKLSVAEKREEAEHKIINFKEYVAGLLTRLIGGDAKFSEISRGRKKEEVIVLFLAVLHLLKDSLIKIRQEDRFSDILLINNV